eukprot:gene16028-22165_t
MDAFSPSFLPPDMLSLPDAREPGGPGRPDKEDKPDIVNSLLRKNRAVKGVDVVPRGPTARLFLLEPDLKLDWRGFVRATTLHEGLFPTLALND